METPKEHPNYFKDMLKAVVLSATVNPEMFQNTLKVLLQVWWQMIMWMRDHNYYVWWEKLGMHLKKKKNSFEHFADFYKHMITGHVNC